MSNKCLNELNVTETRHVEKKHVYNSLVIFGLD